MNPDPADLEQAMAVLDTYHRQIEALVRQLSFLQAVQDETQQAHAALEGLRNEPNREILVPLGANTFLHATATTTERVLSGIGSGLSVDKPTEEAQARLKEREREIQSEMQRVTESVVRLRAEAARLQEEIQSDLDQAGAEGEATTPASESAARSAKKKGPGKGGSRSGA